mmetsp:Transcript_86023/g.267702  ORF Transcript_86023/g.267702 Transcript_86023/m.267702 type:complete len:431 (+) Transcript_86023:152-1444(+)
MTYAFKVLCTDDLASVLLGVGGVVKDRIQKETHTKLVFSQEGEYFPESDYRILAIYADESARILNAIERILPKIIECGEEELKCPDLKAREFTGNTPGEYVFRFCIPDKASRALIGSGGASINQLRKSTGAKIFVENESHVGSRMARVIGRPGNIISCLGSVNDVVQLGAGTEGFRLWAGASGLQQGALALAPAAAGPVAVPSGRPAAGTGPPARPGRAPVDERVARLADAVGGLPPGAALLPYSVACGLPTDRAEVLRQHAPSVEQATGATIDFDVEGASASTGIMSLVGPLMNIYAAHIMMARRSKELELRELEEVQRQQLERQVPQRPERQQREQQREEQRWCAGAAEAYEPGEAEKEQEVPSKADLKRKIDQLQVQLAQVQARMASTGAAGGSDAQSKANRKAAGRAVGKARNSGRARASNGRGRW